MSWARDLNKLATKGGRDLETLTRVVKIKLFTGIVKLTRVDTGRLRGNWQMQESTRPTGVLERVDKSGDIVGKEIMNASPDGVTLFVNNLPYAKPREEKDAMVGQTVSLVRREVRDEARKLV